MGGEEVEAFLTALAVQNKVSASTQNQALAAVLFLYRDVLQQDLPWLANVIDAKRPQRLPVVLTRHEVQEVLAHLSGTECLIAAMLYGGGMRVLECIQLRVKDLELSRREVLIRDAKGQKDRMTILPDSLLPHLRDHLERVRILFDADRALDCPGVSLPFALRRKNPQAATSWGWHWVFPAKSFCLDPYSNEPVRFHLHPQNIQRAVKLAVRATGIVKPASCHTFRHCFATHLPEDGYDIRTVTSALSKSCSATPTSRRR